MPLQKSASKKAFKENIKAEVKAGTPITGFRILQVRSTNTTVTNIVGLN